jgi:HlyD family secretion protein
VKKSKVFLLSVVLLAGAGGGAFFFWEKKEEEKSPHITLYGNVDIRQVNLGFRVFGRVKTLHFEEGDRIKAGQTVALLDKVPYQNQVDVARADLAQKKTSYQNALHISQRKKKLLSSKFASQEDYEIAQATADEAFAQIQGSEAALETALTNLGDTEIAAPTSGKILSRVTEPGSVVNAGDTVYILSLDEPMWARAYISEEDLGRVSLGMKAQIFTDARPHKPYDGQIGFVSPVAEFTPKNVETPELRTKLVYRVRVIVTNPDEYLRQGMPVTVHLKVGA